MEEIGAIQEADDENKPIDPAESALVTQWTERVCKARTHWNKKFDAMRKMQRFIHGKQWMGEVGNDDNRYVVNLALSHINQRVAAIYAKNPRVVGKAKTRMWYSIWDGSTEQWQAAQQAVQQFGPNAPPEVMALVEDIRNGMVRKSQVERIAKTAEKLVQYFFDEPTPRMKTQLKQFVRRVDTCGIGYLKLGYQRVYEDNPTVVRSIADCSRQIAELERMLHERAEGEIPEQSAEMAELRTTLETLQAQSQQLVREGPTFTFLKSWQIIVPEECTNVPMFEGCDWIAEEWMLTPEQIERYYKVDIEKQFTQYGRGGKAVGEKDGKACLFIIYDLVRHVCYHMVDGHPRILKQGAPDIETEQFHPIFPLAFNAIEDDADPWPPSEVELIRHQCMEINRARDEFVQQRVSNRPAYISPKGALTSDDKMALATHENGELVEMDGIPPGTDIRTVVMPKPTMPVDPNIYSDDQFFADIQRQRQTQEANFGGTSGNTATESTIAEAGRVSGIQSNIDELDEWLTTVVRATGQLLLMEMRPETVKTLVGEGAMWPELSREEIAAEVWLDIKAGSTGRPNKALTIANMERLMPFALQTGEISPKWLAGKIVREMDDTVDEDEAMLSGAMPIIAMARLMQPSTGNPMTDPNQQGGEGAANTPGGPQADAQGQGQTGVGAVRQGLDVSAGPPGMM